MARDVFALMRTAIVFRNSVGLISELEEMGSYPGFRFR